MPTLWFWLVAVMIAIYVLLDGFDLGAGIVHLGVARNDAERRAVIRLDRSGMGWERSVAACQRRHSVFCVSSFVRVQLQRILSAADDGVVAAHFARCQH